METTEAVLQRIFFGCIGLLTLFESIILFLRTRANLARRILAYVMLMWGLSYLARYVSLYLPDDNFSESYSLFRVNVLLVGNYFITSMYFFPLQVFLPGWLNWKRVVLLFMPTFAIMMFYLIVMWLTGQEALELTSYAQIWEHLGEFNVWYRLVLMFSNAIYIYIILKWLFRYEKKYIRWKNDNFANQEYMDVSWMRAYSVFMVLIYIAYLAVMAFGTQLPVLIHSGIVMVAMTYIFYKGLFYETPYPQDFFAKPEDTTPEPDPIEILVPQSEVVNLTDNSFEQKIPVYINSLKAWLDAEKPYLYTNFKLTDVARILPLNRSYLSRVFNDGFGRSFSDVIGSYRVEYSKQIIDKDPSMPLYKVAKLSGFNSPSTFIRTFKQDTGITPSQYRMQHSAKTE